MEEGKPAASTTDTDEELNFDSVYANSTYLEASVWDLKVLFGQLELHTGKAVVDWHTAVTLPWVCAKILSYKLAVSLAIHEATLGKLVVPKQVIPEAPIPPTGNLEDDEQAKRIYDLVIEMYEATFGQPTT